MLRQSSLNHLIDVADLLDQSATADEAWSNAVTLAKARGYNALNVVNLSNHTGQVNWFRSSMNTAWLSDYFEQSFLEIDPLIAGAIAGEITMRMDARKAVRVENGCVRAKDCADQLVSWGYQVLETETFGSANQGTTQGVTLTHEGIVPEPAQEHRLFCAMLGGAVQAPQSPDSPGATPMIKHGLSPRETDVLCYLASGLRNDAIAWKMGIAEVTVRAHLQSARQKLGAATREEAIATAIRTGRLPI